MKCNILDIRNRGEFREWLTANGTTEKECWIAVKRGKTPPVDALWYLDAVEEADSFAGAEKIPMQATNEHSTTNDIANSGREKIAP